MCLSHNSYNLFGYCVLYGTWVLVGCVVAESKHTFEDEFRVR